MDEKENVWRVYRCKRCTREFRSGSPINPKNENPYVGGLHEHLCDEGKVGLAEQVGLDREVI